MSKIPALAFLIVGVVLLVFGFNASESVASEVSNAVTGTPTDKSIWLIALGALGVLTGGVWLFVRRSP
jgi:LPXTG-motif cell wall-anchored protein